MIHNIIPGMLAINENEQAFLQTLVHTFSKPNMKVIELGTYTGGSALAMLPVIKENNGKLICIDTFEGSIDVPYTNEKQTVLECFKENIKETEYENFVEIKIGTTHKIAEEIPDNYADIIFIDADHRYSYILDDLINYFPKLKMNGLFCGHDFEQHVIYCNANLVLEKCEIDGFEGKHYGVIRAVCSLFPEVSNVYDTSKEIWGIWYVTKTREKL